MLTRRSFLTSSSALMLTSRTSLAQSIDLAKLVGKEDNTFPGLPPSLEQFANQPSINGQISTYQPYGTNPPTDEEQKIADSILDKVPTNCLPVEVAAYFLDVRNGKYGDDLKPYAAAWPVRWNPVIVEFFRATNTSPSGDTTAWCAAFVNYCLIKAAEGKAMPKGSADPTLSAASRSFRNWSHQINFDLGEKPKLGDIVVFKEVSSPGNGHVAFFISDNGNGVTCLGGNQLEGSPIRHMVSRKAIPKTGSLMLDSYHSDPQLHA